MTILLTCLVTGEVNGQQLPDLIWHHVDEKDGFPAFMSYGTLLQDRLGRIWIGTERGLYTYDGNHLSLKAARPTFEGQLIDMNVQGLYETTDGKLLISLRSKG